MNFVEELRERGMLHDITPGAEDYLKENKTAAYIGIDPTADSLHIGHLAGVMMLKHFQIAGHKPIIVVGGATGMIGDPSGKSAERNLLDFDTIKHNQAAIKKQLENFLDFSGNSENSALMTNNYDWMKEFSFLDFIRDVGKNITVNYMIAKDSVKKRMQGSEGKDAEGLSFTEFSYQLVQGYDFFHLFKNYDCKFQMGGSDQWGNITTGTELIKRMSGEKAYAITCPLITKADGGKFGKTESGNVWLDPDKTSPYDFYQFWLNTSDEDALKYLKIFTILNVEEINNLAQEHNTQAHLRLLQKTLAEKITTMVHGEKEYNNAVAASQILFGKGTRETLENLSESDFEKIFNKNDYISVSKDIFTEGVNILDLLAEKTNAFKSKGELRRLLKENALSINQEKVNDPELTINESCLISGKYFVVRRGKKNYQIIVAE